MQDRPAGPQDEVHVRLTFSRRQLKGGLALALLLVIGSALRSDTIKLSTYYPAPSGVYKRIITTAQTLLARDGGSVGIGTSTPTRQLTLNNNLAGANFSINSNAPSGGDAANVIFSRQGVEKWTLSYYPDGNFYLIKDSGRPSGTSPITVTPSGNIGINDKTNPGFTLDVNGDMNIAAGRSYRIGGQPINLGGRLTSRHEYCKVQPDPDGTFGCTVNCRADEAVTGGGWWRGAAYPSPTGAYSLPNGNGWLCNTGGVTGCSGGANPAAGCGSECYAVCAKLVPS